MKVVRILVYEGTDKFIQRSIERRTVVGTFTGSEGDIREYFVTGPLPILQDPTNVIEELLPKKNV